VIFWNPEDALDVFRVPYADLDVSFAAEACGWIEGFAFGEDGSDGVEGLLAGLFSGGMQVVQDDAVELSMKKIISTRVRGDSVA